jgi:hypothetical protein
MTTPKAIAIWTLGALAALALNGCTGSSPSPQGNHPSSAANCAGLRAKMEQIGSNQGSRTNYTTNLAQQENYQQAYKEQCE